MMADALRVVLVDDEALVRSGLRLLLSNAPDIEVVAEASNGRDAVATVLDAQPDVVLMDIRMPVMDGIAAVERILSVHTVPIIMLTAFDTDSFILRALRAGAGRVPAQVDAAGIAHGGCACGRGGAAAVEPAGRRQAGGHAKPRAFRRPIPPRPHRPHPAFHFKLP